MVHHVFGFFVYKKKPRVEANVVMDSTRGLRAASRDLVTKRQKCQEVSMRIFFPQVLLLRAKQTFINIYQMFVFGDLWGYLGYFGASQSLLSGNLLCLAAIL